MAGHREHADGLAARRPTRLPSGHHQRWWRQSDAPSLLASGRDSVPGAVGGAAGPRAALLPACTVPRRRLRHRRRVRRPGLPNQPRGRPARVLRRSGGADGNQRRGRLRAAQAGNQLQLQPNGPDVQRRPHSHPDDAPDRLQSRPDVAASEPGQPGLPEIAAGGATCADHRPNHVAAVQGDDAAVVAQPGRVVVVGAADGGRQPDRPPRAGQPPVRRPGQTEARSAQLRPKKADDAHVLAPWLREDVHQVVAPQGPPADAHRREAVPVLMEGVRVEIRPVGRAHQTLPQTHRRQTVSVQAVRESLLQVGPFIAAYEKTRQCVETAKTIN